MFIQNQECVRHVKSQGKGMDGHLSALLAEVQGLDSEFSVFQREAAELVGGHKRNRQTLKHHMQVGAPPRGGGSRGVRSVAGFPVGVRVSRRFTRVGRGDAVANGRGRVGSWCQYERAHLVLGLQLRALRLKTSVPWMGSPEAVQRDRRALSGPVIP